MKATHYIWLCALALAIGACGNTTSSLPSDEFNLSCVVDEHLAGDSASLFIVEDGYQRLIDAGERTGKPGTMLKWQGHIDGAHVAFIKWKDDSVPFYFVIEPHDISIKVHGDRWSIKGGQQNKEYIHFLNHRHRILANKENLLKEYNKHAADSTLTQSMENSYLVRDSLLADSLQRYTAWRMTQPDPVALITHERFFNTLSKHYQEKIKKLHK